MSISRNRCGARRSLDRLDQKLDVLVEPDGSWHWKDEDELDEAARLGLLDADAVRAEAKRVLKEWPFPTGCGGETAAKPNPGVGSPQEYSNGLYVGTDRRRVRDSALNALRRRPHLLRRTILDHRPDATVADQGARRKRLRPPHRHPHGWPHKTFTYFCQSGLI